MSGKDTLNSAAVPQSVALSSTLYGLEKVVKPLGEYTQSRQYASIEKCGTMRHCGTVDALHELARMVRRLSPDRRNPERFHEEKSEVAASLVRIAHSLGNTR